MAQRNYSNATARGNLTSPVNAAATTLLVSGFSNPPAVPFTATVERNTASEEVVLVTAVSGAALTVTRGYDGTAATNHFSGAVVEHTTTAIDFREANLHVNQTTGAHGTTGAPVGTQGAQSIQDKTLVSPVLQANTTLGDAAVASVVGAATKNLFRGIGAAGTDVFIVEPDGQVQAVAGTATNHLVTKAQLDAAGTNASTANTVARRDASGGFGVGYMAIDFAPANADNATRKDYVDNADNLRAPKASPTFTGTVTAPRVVTGGDMTGAAASTDAPVQIGANGAVRAMLDSNELWAVNAAGAVSSFFINADFRLGGGSPAITNSAQFATKGYADSLLADTGWVNIVGFTGRTAHANPPQVRKIGSVVYARGGWADTGMAVNTVYNSPAGIIPAAYRPNQTTVMTPGHGAQNRTGRLMIFSDGSVTIESGSTLAGYYVMDAHSWLTD